MCFYMFLHITEILNSFQTIAIFTGFTCFQMSIQIFFLNKYFFTQTTLKVFIFALSHMYFHSVNWFSFKITIFASDHFGLWSVWVCINMNFVLPSSIKHFSANCTSKNHVNIFLVYCQSFFVVGSKVTLATLMFSFRFLN